MPIQSSNVLGADFFVHPDYHRASWSGGPFPEKPIRKYEDALIRRIGASALPILLYDPRKDAKKSGFWHRFEPEHRFPTEPDDGILSPEPEVHSGFNGLLTRKHVVRGVVHGSYLDACVIDFRANLLAGNDRELFARPLGQEQLYGVYAGPDNVQYGITLSARYEYLTIPELVEQTPGLSIKDFAYDAEIHYF